MINKVRAAFEGGSVRGDAAQIYVFQFLSLGVGLIGSIVAARILGPAEKGIFDLFNLLNSFIVEFGLMGFGSGLLYYLANKRRPLSEIHGAGFIFSLTIGMLTAIIGWLGLPLWKMIFPCLHDWIILLAFFLAPIAYYRLIWANIMTGINRAVATYKIGFCFAILSSLSIFALWTFGYLNVKEIISVTAILSVINGAVAFVILHKRYRKLKLSISLMQESLRYGLMIYAGVIANVLHFKIDQVMLNYWLGTKAVGIYAVSVNWAEMLFLLDSAITSAALHKISSSSAEESYALTKRLFKVQLLISGTSGGLLALLAYPLILIFYGEAYRGAIWPLILLVPGIVAWSAFKIVSNMLTFNLKMAPFVTKAAVLGFLLNIFLNYLFIKVMDFGIVGASGASSLSYTLVAMSIGLKARGLSR